MKCPKAITLLAKLLDVSCMELSLYVREIRYVMIVIRDICLLYVWLFQFSCFLYSGEGSASFLVSCRHLFPWWHKWCANTRTMNSCWIATFCCHLWVKFIYCSVYTDEVLINLLLLSSPTISETSTSFSKLTEILISPN